MSPDPDEQFAFHYEILHGSGASRRRRGSRSGHPEGSVFLLVRGMLLRASRPRPQTRLCRGWDAAGPTLVVFQVPGRELGARRGLPVACGCCEWRAAAASGDFTFFLYFYLFIYFFAEAALLMCVHPCYFFFFLDFFFLVRM